MTALENKHDYLSGWAQIHIKSSYDRARSPLQQE